MTLPDEFADVLAGVDPVPDPLTAAAAAGSGAAAGAASTAAGPAAGPTPGGAAGSPPGSGAGGPGSAAASSAAESSPAPGAGWDAAGAGAGASSGSTVPEQRRAPRLGPEATDLPPLDTPDLPDLGSGSAPVPQRDLRLLADVQVELAVELGRVKLPLRDLLALGPGAVLELDRPADAPVDVLVNGHLVARGEVVVIDGDFGVRVTAVVQP